MIRFPIVRSILTGAAVLALAGCASLDAAMSGDAEASDAAPSPSMEDGVPVNFLELSVGDCFDIPTNLPAGEALRYSSCEVLHQFEAFAQSELPAGEFPGDDAIDAAATETCEPAFREFVGESWQSSEYDFQFIIPSEATWNELGDRSVLCMVTALDGLPWTGSAKGAAR